MASTRACMCVTTVQRRLRALSGLMPCRMARCVLKRWPGLFPESMCLSSAKSLPPACIRPVQASHDTALLLAKPWALLGGVYRGRHAQA